MAHPFASARSRGLTFRMAPDASTPVRTTSELEERLHRRLRLLSLILAYAVGALAVVTLVLRRTQIASRPATFWTEPPMPGVMFVISIIAAALAVRLSPRRHPGLPALRRYEWFGVALTAAFFVLNQLLALRGMLPGFLGRPMELGVAQGAPWGILIVGYAVLVPSSTRHAIMRTAAIAAVAFIPELFLLPDAALHAPAQQLFSYLALKAFIIALMSALALYGSYRIEELGEQAEVARELGQYLLRRMIGEGGMGSVYLAEHRLLRRPCAVKLIRAEQAQDDLALARFEREVQSAAALTHPNTVQIYDYGQSDDGTFYFAMEFLPGITLDDLVTKHGVVPPARAVHILRQLCGALHEAHVSGMVHRDLKPGNVMLCERGGVPDVVKLLDFGLVAALAPEQEPVDSRLTREGVVIGTPAFMSPEQCVGEARITPASDIYSLGALGYFLLTGAGPFTGRNAMITLMAHVNEPPEPVTARRPGLPTPLADVLLRCLAKEPTARYPDVLAVDGALRDSLSDQQWTRDDALAWWRSV